MSPLLNHDMKRFVKLWREIERAQADLDFRRSEWARDVREACGTDRAFVTWCKHTIGLTERQCTELLARAATVKVVSDAATWNRLGGFQSLEKVATLPKREQVAVIEAAKAQSLSVRTVLKQRGHTETRHAPAVPMARKPVALEPESSPRETRIGVMRDARELAQYIDKLRKSGTKVPANVAAIVDMYK